MGGGCCVATGCLGAGAGFGVADIVGDAGGLIQQMLNWLTQVALWGPLASIMVGAAAWGLSQNMEAYSNAYRGKQLALAGVVGACLAGVAPTAVKLLFRAAGG